MKYFFFLLLILLFGCSSTISESESSTVDFEEVNHFSYELISGEYLIIDSQKQMDEVFSIIHKNSEGVRLAPIPTVNELESYLIIKQTLKNKNDLEILEIKEDDHSLKVTMKEINNPQLPEKNRGSTNVLIKILKKIDSKKIITNIIQN